MATYVAVSDIKWGKDADNVKTFHDGDTVTGPSEDEMKQLADAGAIVLKSDYRKGQSNEEAAKQEAENEELRKRNEEANAEIAKLRLALQQAENKTPAQQTPAQQKP
jgi:hypothetical protein